MSARTLSSRHLILISVIWLCFVGPAFANEEACVICSVEQSQIHTEDCSFSSDWNNQTYFFCREDCQKRFLTAPQEWASKFAALDDSGKSGLSEGESLPKFRFPIDPIGSVSSSDVEGRVLLLNLWANWCAPCLKEMPDLVGLQKEIGNEELVVIALSFDKSRQEHRDGVEKLDLNFPSIYANQPEVQTFLKKLGPIKSIPVTFIVDKEGRLVKRINGAADLEKFRELVKPLLESKQQSAEPERLGAVVPS